MVRSKSDWNDQSDIIELRTIIIGGRKLTLLISDGRPQRIENGEERKSHFDALLFSPEYMHAHAMPVGIEQPMRIEQTGDT